MGVPSKLKNFNIYADGASLMGVAKEVTLPKIMAKMEEWRGGGMLGPIKIDTGLGAIDMEFTLGGISNIAFKQFGATQYDAAALRFAGGYQEDGNGAVQALEVTCRGRYEELDLGNATAGGDTEHKYKMTCAYYKLVVDGVTWLEIDLVAMVYKVFGVDRYAQIRAAIS